MSYKPSDPYAKQFTTASPSSGAAADADSLPVATADWVGSGTGAMALTVASVSTGLYRITGTIPGTRARGDVLNVSVAATVGGIAGKACVDTQVIDSKRVGDLADAPAAPTAAQVAASVWQDATAGDFTVTGSIGKYIMTGVTINLAQSGFTPRNLGTVADAALTVGDALMAAICATAGRESVVGTTYTKKTPSTGTVIRAFTLDSPTAPTSRD